MTSHADIANRDNRPIAEVGSLIEEAFHGYFMGVSLLSPYPIRLRDFCRPYGKEGTNRAKKRGFGIELKRVNVGIGTTGPANILTIQQASATDPIADAWTIYSSRRWKANIEPITGALAKVQALEGVYFDWKADGKHDIGMIAEEVGEIIPEVVEYEENGTDAKSLDYARLVAMLIEAVKEQQAQIEALQEEVAELKGEM